MKQLTLKQINIIRFVIMGIGIAAGVVCGCIGSQVGICVSVFLVLLGFLFGVWLYRCPHCGQYIRSVGFVFCPDCGKRIDDPPEE